jgi:hypothetical protein
MTTKPPRFGSESSDLLDGDVPGADEAASSAEKARAKSFADLIDKAIAGRTPPALSADERALLEVTTVIRAAAGHADLGAAQRRAVVEQALAQALGPASSSGMRTSSLMDAGVPAGGAPRGRWSRRAPWMVAGTTTLIAAAAVLAMWLAPPPAPVVVTAPESVPETWRSRPADALVGEIRREAAGDAAARLDSIYSDRLDGYRDATLFRPKGER